MSNDLIRREKVLEEIRKLLRNPYANDPDIGVWIRDAITTVRDLCVRSAPTAYDVGKVGDRLESYLLEKYCVEGDTKIEEIIKSGGIG